MVASQPMQQHPVPQNISSYEFRLVGDMTLKQFFQLAGGFLVAFILYKTALPGILKWPLMFISGLTGVLMAFVPVNGRPFSQWILAFIHAIYSPTRFVWNPAKSTFVFSEPPLPDTENRILDTKTQTPLDKFESQLFSRFTELFNSKTPSVNTQPAVPVAQNSPAVPREASSEVGPIATPPPPPTNPEPMNPPTPLTPVLSHTPLKPVTEHRILNTATSIPTPEYPNILTGLVANPQGASVESAILEITDIATGIPVRALRTNKLGQFQIATPLGNGKYQISTEKDGLIFENLAIETTGKIINPIQITAKT